MNVRKEAGLTLPGTMSNYLELDLFLPELHLAFEFQVLFYCYFIILFYGVWCNLVSLV